MPAASGLLDLGDQLLAYKFVGPQPDSAPTLVLLHEGLGAVELWQDFPDHLAARTGCGVFAYSRAGYGRSSPVRLPRPLTYMHDEAKVLPRVLDAIGFQRGFLIGHSDGASIATIYAGTTEDHRICGLSLIAPHFVVEDISVTEIAKIKQTYATSDLPQKLAKYHDDVEGAFRGWNDAWLDPDFRRWDISESLAYIRVPIQIIQGAADQYGTLRQVEIAQREAMCPVEAVVLPGIGHWPHREAKAVTLDAVAAFCAHVRALAA